MAGDYFRLCNKSAGAMRSENANGHIAALVASRAEAVDISSADHTVSMEDPGGIFIGGAGDLICTLADDSSTVTLKVLAGQIVPVVIKSVDDSSTCTDMVILG